MIECIPYIFRVMRTNESCSNCEHRPVEVCQLHGYVWLDYVARVTKCSNWEQRRR